MKLHDRGPGDLMYEFLKNPKPLHECQELARRLALRFGQEQDVAELFAYVAIVYHPVKIYLENVTLMVGMDV